MEENPYKSPASERHFYVTLDRIMGILFWVTIVAAGASWAAFIAFMIWGSWV